MHIRITAILLALTLAIGADPAAAQVAAQGPAKGAACEYTYDGECDESFGTGLCAEGTDTWDCRRTGAPPGPESCRYSRDGECDEPGGTGACPIAGTDTADCRAAGIDPLRVFFGRDDRIWPNSSKMPWSAIGRITFVSGGQCTGSLVGPDTVLTAAHCLFGGDGPGGYDRPLEFIAGASGASFVARANIVGEFRAPQFDIKAHENTSDVDGYDWAFLTLDRPIGNEAGWLLLAPLSAAELRSAEAGLWLGESGQLLSVMQGGYSADAASFLSANIGCRILRVWDDNTIFHDCDTLQGDSGSPLFVRDGNDYRVIGVESATYPNDDKPYDDNMAVDARAFWKGPSGLDTAPAPPAAPAPDPGSFKNTRAMPARTAPAPVASQGPRR